MITQSSIWKTLIFIVLATSIVFNIRIRPGKDACGIPGTSISTVCNFDVKCVFHISVVRSPGRSIIPENRVRVQLEKHGFHIIKKVASSWITPLQVVPVGIRTKTIFDKIYFIY